MPEPTIILNNREFRALLDWFMCSDPFPVDGETHSVVEHLLDRAAAERGHKDWVDAYHYHQA